MHPGSAGPAELRNVLRKGLRRVGYEWRRTVHFRDDIDFQAVWTHASNQQLQVYSLGPPGQNSGISNITFEKENET